MELNKKEFLKTMLGLELRLCLRYLNKELEIEENPTQTEQDRWAAGRQAMIYREKWLVIRMAILQFYDIDYRFIRTDTHFGAATKDEQDWLFREERKKRNAKETGTY